MILVLPSCSAWPSHGEAFNAIRTLPRAWTIVGMGSGSGVSEGPDQHAIVVHNRAFETLKNSGIDDTFPAQTIRRFHVIGGTCN